MGLGCVSVVCLGDVVRTLDLQFELLSPRDKSKTSKNIQKLSCLSFPRSFLFSETPCFGCVCCLGGSLGRFEADSVFSEQTRD